MKISVIDLEMEKNIPCPSLGHCDFMTWMQSWNLEDRCPPCISSDIHSPGDSLHEFRFLQHLINVWQRSVCIGLLFPHLSVFSFMLLYLSFVVIHDEVAVVLLPRVVSYVVVCFLFQTLLPRKQGMLCLCWSLCHVMHGFLDRVSLLQSRIVEQVQSR
jgi:hypothetical protein